MTKEQFDKLYVGENLAVHCDTEEKAKELLSLAHSFGYKWCTGEPYKNETNNYDTYKEDMCYILIEGSYAGLEFCKSMNYTIVEYELQRTLKKVIEKIVFNEEKGRVTLVFKDELGKYGSVISQTNYGDRYEKEIGILIVLIKFYFGKEEAKRIIDECFELSITLDETLYLLLGVLIPNKNYNLFMIQDIEAHEEKEWVYKDYLKRLRKQKKEKRNEQSSISR